MATSPIYSWPEPDNTDLVKNGALAIRTLGDAIDTTMGTMVAKTIIDAKGDLIAGTAADTAARLAVGTNGQTLVADSSTATGLKWATASSGGKLKQFKFASTTTAFTTSSTSYVDYTGLSITMSMTSASNTLVLVAILQAYNSGSTATVGQFVRILDGGGGAIGTQVYSSVNVNKAIAVPIMLSATPGTTSSQTYKVQVQTESGGKFDGLSGYAQSFYIMEVEA